MKIKKAIFPVAGLGTRFLPATKASPKEMMPVVDKPLIQYAVEEAIAAGITELIFVTSSTKRAIEDHFDQNFELEIKLKEKKKLDLLKEVQNIPPQGVSCIYVRQQETLGLGHAILCAKDLIGEEPFAILLADDLIDGPCLTEMLAAMKKKQAAGVLAVTEVSAAETQNYGIVVTDTTQRVTQMVEKPKPHKTPSRLAIVGRYILPPQIFKHLERTKKGAGNEIQLTDAIAALLDEFAIYAHKFSGTRYDCGDKLGYLKANLQLGLQHKECGPEWREYLRKLVL
jgi:UTP--glucose-1-phosphate uridylyltransferase